MNQQCKVCGEPAAGFHFGAFTCEGCKSFFGRTYNNISSISECKNNRECIINKKNRTACKACRLRKCLLVGMSKSGSRYGRRSNWFKIHCLLQEQQQKGISTNGISSIHNDNNNSSTNNNNNNNGGNGRDIHDRRSSNSPSMATNTLIPVHFLTNISNLTKLTIDRPSESSSDSGASSADPDDTHRDSSIESFSIKTEKSSASGETIVEPYRTPHIPYIPSNNRLSFNIPDDRAAAAFVRNNADTHGQSEPIDLSLKTRKRKSSPMTLVTSKSSSISPPPLIDIPKLIPLDLTLVRSNPLSG